MPSVPISSLAVSGRGGSRGGGRTGSEPVDNDGFPLAALPVLAECAESSFAISSGWSWSVDNDGLRELFILLAKNDGVVTSSSPAPHEWFSLGDHVRVFGLGVQNVLGASWRCKQFELLLLLLNCFFFGLVTVVVSGWTEFFCDIFGLFMV